jgi:BlaI family penicillinase repressor
MALRSGLGSAGLGSAGKQGQLHDGGLVKRDEAKLSHIYTAAVDQTANQEQMVGGLIDRAFGGSVSELILRALSAKPASAKELEAIRALLSDAKSKPSSRKKDAGK